MLRACDHIAGQSYAEVADELDSANAQGDGPVSYDAEEPGMPNTEAGEGAGAADAAYAANEDSDDAFEI